MPVKITGIGEESLCNRLKKAFGLTYVKQGCEGWFIYCYIALVKKIRQFTLQ